MRRVLILVLLMFLAACGARAPMPWRTTDISGADFGHALVGLKDQHGKPTTLDDFRGRAVLLFFGYTACPDVCPATLARYAAVMKALGADADRVQVLFVTLDPERDTPDKLAAYVSWFDPRFIGLYGDLAATRRRRGNSKFTLRAARAARGWATP